MTSTCTITRPTVSTTSTSAGENCFFVTFREGFGNLFADDHKYLMSFSIFPLKSNESTAQIIPADVIKLSSKLQPKIFIAERNDATN
jgi:hypothetical protein